MKANNPCKPCTQSAACARCLVGRTGEAGNTEGKLELGETPQALHLGEEKHEPASSREAIEAGKVSGGAHCSNKNHLFPPFLVSHSGGAKIERGE